MRIYLALCGAALLVLSGCMVGPDFSTPSTRLESQWSLPQKTEFTTEVQASTDRLMNPVQWWSAFNDPTLTDLLQRAARQNLTLQSAAVRIFQARSQLGVTDATLLPTVSLTGQAVAQRPTSLSIQPSNSSSISQYNTLVQANWEIDFWGKFRRGIESATATYMSTVAAYYAADVSLAADVANTYINIRKTEQLIDVANANLALQAESLRIASARYKYGQTSLLDLSQAQSQYEQTKSDIPTLINSLKSLYYSMGVLLGEDPLFYEKQYGMTKSSLEEPQSLEIGIPRDLLRRRPDVLEAEFNAASQSALIGVNQAALYPSFSLLGYFGFQGASVNTGENGSFTWSNNSSSIAGSFLFPLFYRGALVDQVRVQDAAFQRAVLNYQNVVLNAQKEVQSSLMLISTSRSSAADLQKAVVSSKRAAELALDRYKQGQNDYNVVIVAQQSLLAVQNAYVQSKANTLIGFVGAYKSLGGGWSGEMNIPQLPADMINDMQQRTDWGQVLQQTADPRLVKTTDTP